MYTLSPTPIPNAPPEAPSPTITLIGTFKRSFQICFWQWLLLAHAPRLLNQDKLREYQSSQTGIPISLPFSLNATLSIPSGLPSKISILTHLSIDSFFDLQS
jgi:hypothetical protein